MIRHPGSQDTGIRYYRPKPYLFVKPLTDSDGLPVGGYVNLETVMLPDLDEEYSIHIRSGLGINKTSVKLENGWNLTQLNVDIDSQVDESLKSVAAMMEAIPGLTAGGKSDPQMVVRATNVPLGLYESVISCSPDCTKRLLGFRYIGFMPYTTSHFEACSLDEQRCGDGPLYGLVMENGAMLFRPLYEAAQHINLNRIDLAGEEELLSDLDAEPLDPTSMLRRLPKTNDHHQSTR